MTGSRARAPHDLDRGEILEFLRLVAIAAAYFVAGRFGLSLAYVHPSASAIWPPTGVAIAALLVFGERLWPGVLVGAFLVNVTTSEAPTVSAIIASGNTLEAFLACRLTRRYASGLFAFERVRSFLTFVALGALASTMVSATVGTLALIAGGLAPASAFVPVSLSWWLGDAAGALILAPGLVLWSQRPRPGWSRLRSLEAALLVVSTAVTGVAVFTAASPLAVRHEPIQFMCLPVVVWSALRFGPREVATVIPMLSAVAVWGTLGGYGPFGGDPERLTILPAFMAMIGVIGMVLGANASELRELLRRERAARAEAQRIRDRFGFLAAASSALSASLDYDTTLGVIAKLAVPNLADICTVDLFGPDESVRRLPLVCADPAQAELVRGLERYPIRISHPADPRTEMLRTRVPWLASELSEDALRAIAQDARQLQLMHELEYRSLLAVPLLGGGRVHGILTLVFTRRDRRYDAEDVTMVEELGRHCGLALENARLYRESRDATHEREDALAREELARDQAEAANRAKDDFLAALSHELRSPLSAVLIWTHLLREGNLDPAKEAHGLELIERNTKLQARLIEDLLDVSRIAAGKMKLDFVAVDVASTVSNAVDSAQHVAETRGVALTCTLRNRPLPVRGDPDRLQQIFGNLISNALKFTPRGGAVEVEARAIGAHAEIVVRDTGEGIRRDLLEKIFERFEQADGTITRKQTGLGLGLTIARHLVSLHGGRIAAHSAGENQGAVFEIILPLESAADLPPAFPTSGLPAFSAQAEERQGAALLGVRVLVVDDEAAVRDAFSTLLSLEGAVVATAGSVAEALRLFRLHPPDVLVTDLAMPEEDGYALLQAVRAFEPCERRVPVIAVTALAGIEDRVRVHSAGFDLHVAKPVAPPQLIAAVAAVIRRVSEARATG